MCDLLCFCTLSILLLGLQSQQQDTMDPLIVVLVTSSGKLSISSWLSYYDCYDCSLSLFRNVDLLQNIKKIIIINQTF